MPAYLLLCRLIGLLLPFLMLFNWSIVSIDYTILSLSIFN